MDRVCATFSADDLARTVQCDGTSVTNCIERAGGLRLGCMGIARRRLSKPATRATPSPLDGLRLMPRCPGRASPFLLAGDSAEMRRARRASSVNHHRQTQSLALDEHRGLIHEDPLGRALGYLHRQWLRLTLSSKTAISSLRITAASVSCAGSVLQKKLASGPGGRGGGGRPMERRSRRGGPGGRRRTHSRAPDGGPPHRGGVVSP